jgi:hypothetical protein
MIDIEMELPEFAKAVNFCISQKKTKPAILLCPLMAFNLTENELLGSAMKFCSLNNVTVHCVGSGEKDYAYLDATKYSVFEVGELGAKLRILCSQHKSVLLKAKETHDIKDVVTFVREPNNLN